MTKQKVRYKIGDVVYFMHFPERHAEGTFAEQVLSLGEIIGIKDKERVIAYKVAYLAPFPKSQSTDICFLRTGKIDKHIIQKWIFKTYEKAYAHTEKLKAHTAKLVRESRKSLEKQKTAAEENKK